MGLAPCRIIIIKTFSVFSAKLISRFNALRILVAWEVLIVLVTLVRKLWDNAYIVLQALQQVDDPWINANHVSFRPGHALKVTKRSKRPHIIPMTTVSC